jgi:hypothetical protein
MLVSFLGVLHGLPGQLVSAHVISLFVMRYGGPVSMGGKLVKLGGSSMGIARHTLILTRGQEISCPRIVNCYAVRMDSDLSPDIAACAAANLAIGTR